jgi:hypothetical protein
MQTMKQGGVTAQAEVDAVLKQIEGTRTQEQLEAIAAMQLRQKDLWVWMQEQGLGRLSGGEMPPEMATRMAEFQGMSEEEREAARATMQAGGGMPGRPGAPGEASGRQFVILLNPLIELLEARAGEA